MEVAGEKTVEMADEIYGSGGGGGFMD